MLTGHCHVPGTLRASRQSPREVAAERIRATDLVRDLKGSGSTCRGLFLKVLFQHSRAILSRTNKFFKDNLPTKEPN